MMINNKKDLIIDNHHDSKLITVDKNIVKITAITVGIVPLIKLDIIPVGSMDKYLFKAHKFMILIINRANTTATEQPIRP